MSGEATRKAPEGQVRVSQKKLVARFDDGPIAGIRVFDIEDGWESPMPEYVQAKIMHGMCVAIAQGDDQLTADDSTETVATYHKQKDAIFEMPELNFVGAIYEVL
jgi:hypothetical protein